jgi:hypothetical protein
VLNVKALDTSTKNDYQTNELLQSSYQMENSHYLSNTQKLKNSQNTTTHQAQADDKVSFLMNSTLNASTNNNNYSNALEAKTSAKGSRNQNSTQ